MPKLLQEMNVSAFTQHFKIIFLDFRGRADIVGGDCLPGGIHVCIQNRMLSRMEQEMPGIRGENVRASTESDCLSCQPSLFQIKN